VDKIIVLGTGCASVTKIFNTCFALTNDDENYILVDAGGEQKF
jgi:Metal-dependent hydrolases of the beta-lactamase superfamily III